MNPFSMAALTFPVHDGPAPGLDRLDTVITLWPPASRRDYAPPMHGSTARAPDALWFALDPARVERAGARSASPR